MAVHSNSKEMTQPKRRRRLLRMALPAMAFVGSVAAVGAAGSGTASAACNPGWYSWSIGWASETPNANTCDNLKDFNSTYQDNALDSRDVRIRYDLADGVGWRYYPGRATALNTPYYWGFNDTNTTSNGFAACKYFTSGGGLDVCTSTSPNQGY